MLLFFTGVEDNGRLAGLSREEMKASLKTLRDMAARLGATTDVLREKFTNNNNGHCNNNKEKNNRGVTQQKGESENKRVAEVLVKKLRKDDREDQETVVELRLAVTGGQDAGKSTLLGREIASNLHRRSVVRRMEYESTCSRCFDYFFHFLQVCWRKVNWTMEEGEHV